MNIRRQLSKLQMTCLRCRIEVELINPYFNYCLNPLSLKLKVLREEIPPMKLFSHEKWNLMFEIVALFCLCICHDSSQQQQFSWCPYSEGLSTLLITDVFLRQLFPSSTKIPS